MIIEGEEDGQDGELLLTDELPPEDGEGAAIETPPAQQEGDVLELVIEGDDDGNEGEILKQLRDRLRVAQIENAQLKKASAAPKTIEVGKKPDLYEDCDGDPDRYERELLDWHQRDSAARQQQTQQTEQIEAQTREFNRFRARVQKRAETLGITDYEKAEEAIGAAMGDSKLAGLAMRLARDPARAIAAISRSPHALAKLEAEKDDVEKIKLILDMESKIVDRKKPPEPEAGTIQRGTAPIARVDHDKKLAQLEKEAERTGRRDAVIKYKREMKAKAA